MDASSATTARTTKLQYRLHPGIRVFKTESEKLRFSGPFRDVLVTDGAGLLKRLVPALEDPDKLQVAISDLDGEEHGIAEEMIAALANVDLVIESDAAANKSSVDALAHSLDVAARQVSRLRGYSKGLADEFLGKAVLTLGAPPSLHEALRRLGMKPHPESSPDAEAASVIVAWASEANMDALRVYNRRARELEKPALFVVVGRHHVTLGPVFIPVESACLACLDDRWRSNAMHVAEGEADSLLAGTTETSAIAATFAAQAAAPRVAAMAAGLSHLAPPGEVVEIDLVTLQTRKGRVLRAPRCPVCSSHQVSEFRAVRAASVE